MRQVAIQFAWREPVESQRFRNAVCLHGHTMHSEECLEFLPRYLRQVPGVAQVLWYYERRQGADFKQSFWTPPLSPASALDLEQAQIASLGLRPLVSLTDHDNIEAGMSLQVTADRRAVPVSVEWTAPYERSILHLGIHNLPGARAREWMTAMASYTARPAEEKLPGMLQELAKIPDLLIVLNHPFWLEEGVKEADHDRALARVLRECLPWLHAFELNGTRKWEENRRVSELAEAHGRPVISGGDRHACEPAACLNLTNAETFAEFAAEIRAGQSTLLFLPQYREPMAERVLQAAWDILRPYPEYPGREQWTDRVFYRGEDGVARPLSMVWQNHVPWLVQSGTALIQLAATSGLRAAIRLVVAERGEILP